MKILCTYMTNLCSHSYPPSTHRERDTPPTQPTPPLTLGDVLVPAHGEVVDAAHVGPVEARWKVLHVNVLVRQRLRDPLALGESSCVKRNTQRESAREQS